MKRPTAVTVIRVAGVIFLLYLLAQVGALRWVRDQMRESVRGPSPEQVRAAAEAPPPQLPPALPRVNVARKAWLADPPSAATMVTAFVAIIAVAFVAMFLTGRQRLHRG